MLATFLMLPDVHEAIKNASCGEIYPVWSRTGASLTAKIALERLKESTDYYDTLAITEGEMRRLRFFGPVSFSLSSC
jgi:multidrug transporter EmrE-like cation transporter